MIVNDEQFNKAQYEHYKKLVQDYINKHCIVRGKMPAKKPGKFYNWCLYLRNGLFNPSFLHYVSEMMLYRLRNEFGSFKFQICGVETAGTPLAAALPLIAQAAYNVHIDSFVIRKQRKDYALLNWHEGMYDNSKPYILIDDFSNSSLGLKHADDICKKNLNLTSANLAMVIINKVNIDNNISGKIREKTDMFLPKSTKIISLFTLDDFGLYVDNTGH